MDMLAQGLAHRDNPPRVLYLVRTVWGVSLNTTGGTFKVNQAIPIEVDVLQDLVHFPLPEALPQQGLEGGPKLPHADAAIPVGIKLWRWWLWLGGH